MERSDIVRRFLVEGYQLASDALEYFEKNPEKVEPFVNIIKGRGDKPTITRSLVEEVVGSISPGVAVVKSFASRQSEKLTGTIADNLSKRYQRMAEILSKKSDLTNLVSINRVSEADNKKFSIIGMVREISPGDRTVLVEDLTGNTSVYIADEAAGDFNYLVEDEVVGLVCDAQEWVGKRALKIVFPDIPLPTKISSSQSEESCMFISDVHMDDPKFLERSYEKLGDYLKKIKEKTTVFVLGDVSQDEGKIKKFREMFPENFSVMMMRGHAEEETQDYLPDPVVVEIGGVKIFMSHGSVFQKYFERFNTSPENMLLQLVKKRHLSPTFNSAPGLDDEGLELTDVPDIFVIGHYHDPRILNYKGTTLISLGSFVTQPVFWSVNLKTRETIKIDLT